MKDAKELYKHKRQSIMDTFNPEYDFKTSDLNACVCGFKPQWYSVYYGRTPYDVFCPTCKKQTIHYLAFSGNHFTVIKFWNEVVSKTSDPKKIKEAILSSPEWSDFEQFQKRFSDKWPKEII